MSTVGEVTSAPPAPTLESQPATVAPEPTELATEPEPEPEPEPWNTLPPVEKPEPQGGAWTELDLTMRSAADVAKATELPQSLRDFLAARIGVEDQSGCTVEKVELLGMHADGFVFGHEDSGCGGVQAVWGIADNQWSYIVAFLDAPPCADVAYNGVPEGAPGLRCTDDNGQARDY